jgi:two-component system sensor histidine kinase ResE
MRELILEVLAAFQVQAKTTEITLQADVQEGLPRLEIDPIRIREVFGILLTNALHYIAPGEKITIRAELESSDPEKLIVSVVDSGTGIGDQDLPHIFERFYKSGESQGSGLGLAIAKSLIEAHNGKITAQSEPGQGTKIKFTLPVSRAV